MFNLLFLLFPSHVHFEHGANSEEALSWEMILAFGTEGERNDSTAFCDAVALALHFVGDEV